MHFDALTVACIAAELQHTIEGGRIQQVIAADEQSIGMEIYAQRQRYYLLLSGDPRASRVHLVQEKLRRGVESVSPLLLLLRKYVRGSQLTTIDQPDPTERLLHFHFSHPEHGRTQLVAELIGQRGNLILLNEEEQILDSLRRMWASEGVQRPVMPKQPYISPPSQDKLAPFGAIKDGLPNNESKTMIPQLQRILQTDEPLWRVLVTNFAGVSPTLAQEVAWRATGRIEALATEADPSLVAEAMQALWNMIASGRWEPGVWLEDGVIQGFAPYVVHGRGDFVATESMSMALERYYNESRQSSKPTNKEQGKEQDSVKHQEDNQRDGYAPLRHMVTQQIEHAAQRLQRQLEALTQDEPAPGEADQLRVQAEWLLALSSQIVPEQQKLEVDLGDWELQIDLVEGKTPVEQAEQMFDRAAKLERAASIIPERRTKVEGDLEYLAQLGLDLIHAENQPEIAAIQDELRAMGLLSTGSTKKVRGQTHSQPLRYHAPEGFEIIVGRNARQNEKVTFDIANAEDLWLHARGAPGAHVVIRSGGQKVSEETMLIAAQLAAYHSKMEGERAATVIVTQRRFVSRAPGGRPGQVLVRQEGTVTVPGILPTALYL